MSKELTEQWKNGTLYGGWYFLEFENGSILPVYYCGFTREFEFGWNWKISKVLSPASYSQFVELTEKVKELEKRLKEANEMLRWAEAKVAWGFEITPIEKYFRKWGVK